MRRMTTALFQPLALAMAIACLALALPGEAARAMDRGKLETFLQVTGFDVALDSIALSAESAPEMLGMNLSDFGESWSSMAAIVFDQKIMHDMALDMLDSTLSEELLTHATDFYASDLGKRLVEVENAAHMADDETKAEDGAALLARYEEENPKRLQILEDLNGAVDSGDNGVRAIQEIQVRFLMAASNAGVLDYVIDEGALRAALREDAAELRASIEAASMATSAHTYQSLSNEDLADYVTALRAPEMQSVYELMNAIQHEVMANRFELLAVRMAALRTGEEL